MAEMPFPFGDLVNGAHGDSASKLFGKSRRTQMNYDVHRLVNSRYSSLSLISILILYNLHKFRVINPDDNVNINCLFLPMMDSVVVSDSNNIIQTSK